MLPIGNYDVLCLDEGKEYQFEIMKWSWHRVYETPGGKYQDMEPNMFDEYFYSKQEERKIKLKQLK